MLLILPTALCSMFSGILLLFNLYLLLIVNNCIIISLMVMLELCLVWASHHSLEVSNTFIIHLFILPYE